MDSQQTQPGSLSETESPVSLCRFRSKGASSVFERVHSPLLGGGPHSEWMSARLTMSFRTSLLWLPALALSAAEKRKVVMLPVLTTALQGELSSPGIFLLSFEARKRKEGGWPCHWDGFIAPAMNEGQERSPSEDIKYINDVLFPVLITFWNCDFKNRKRVLLYSENCCFYKSIIMQKSDRTLRKKHSWGKHLELYTAIIILVIVLTQFNDTCNMWSMLQHVSTNWNKRGKGIAVVWAISSGTENIVTGMDLLHLLWMRDRRGHHQKVLSSRSRKFTLKPEMGLSARMEISLLSN